MRRPRLQARAGFSLIEIMISMTLLTIVLLSLGRLAAIVATRGRTNDISAKRNGVLQQEANKFGAIPFDSLATFPTADRSFTVGGFSYTRRLTITTVSSTYKTVKVVIVPTRDATLKDSVFLSRTKATTTPLCSGC